MLFAACLAFAGSGAGACEVAPPPPVQRSVATAKAVHFETGMVSFTFDDGWIGQATYAAPRLDARGWKGTFYLVPQWFGKSKDREAFMTVEQARAIALGGHEIGDHTMTHQHLPTLSSQDIRQQMLECRGFLADRLGISPQQVTSFASPYGDFDGVVLGHARLLFSSHRTTQPGLNTPSSDPYTLAGVSLGVGSHGHPIASTQKIATFIANAAAEKQWLVFVVHGIVEGSSHRRTDMMLTDFDALLDQVEAAQLKVVTLRQGVDAMLDLRGDESATEEALDSVAGED